MLVLVHDAGGIAGKEATWWERLVARARASALDRRLAAGCSPETSRLLALRALTVVRPSMRRSLAMSLIGVLAEAAEPPAPRRSPRVPVSRSNVSTAADVLTMLIDRLLAPGPVCAGGMAQVRALLSDGSGPLYYGARGADLRRSATAAVEALDPFTNL